MFDMEKVRDALRCITALLALLMVVQGVVVAVLALVGAFRITVLFSELTDDVGLPVIALVTAFTTFPFQLSGCCAGEARSGYRTIGMQMYVCAFIMAASYGVFWSAFKHTEVWRHETDGIILVALFEFYAAGLLWLLWFFGFIVLWAVNVRDKEND